MSHGDTLFDDNATPSDDVVVRETDAALGPPDWLLKQLRQSLDKQGTSAMAERRRIVERLVGRDVPSLRDLTTGEAQLLLGELHRLGSDSTTTKPRGSVWDARDEETWIDRL